MTATGMLVLGAGEFAVLAGGGALAGAVVAAGVIVVRRRITDPVLETVVALITPYAAYLLGEALHVSAVTAVIVAGLAIGARRSRITTAQTRLQLHAVYQTVIFVLESVVFSLIGLELPTLVRELGHTGQWLVAALAVTGTLIATRVAWVFPVWALSQRRHGTHRPAWPVPAVVSWAGTRGVVPLAAALSIPLTTTSGAALPQRDLVLVLAAAAIVISLIVQGFTLEPLARFAGFDQAKAGDPIHEETVARLRLTEAGLARLEELAEAEAAPDAVIDRLRTGLQARITNAGAGMNQSPDEERGAMSERELRGDLIAAENAELSRLFEAGTISAATHRQLQRNLDLELARLTEGQR
jgi:CPA1 family monovalent cation:H+ antiporter